MIYTHKKTGKKYRVLDIIEIKVTGKPKKIAMLKEDFWEKFE